VHCGTDSRASLAEVTTRRLWAGTVFSLIVVANLCMTTTVHAYEGDHFAWTYYVAISCGFSERQAYQLASGAMAIDFDEETAPLPGPAGIVTSALGVPPAHLPPIWRSFHAFTPSKLRGDSQAVENFKKGQLNALRTVGIQDGNPGAALHFTQDYVPHYGWDDWRGHGPAGHLPDFISSESTGPATATERTIEELQRFGRARQLSVSCKDTRIDQVLQRLVAAHTTPFEMRDRIDEFRGRYYRIFFDALGGSYVLVGDFVAKSNQLLGEFGLSVADLDVAPELEISLEVVRAAVKEDKESGLLETYTDPTKGRALPGTWLTFDYDAEGHVRQDPRYPVEQPELEVGRPTATYRLQGEGPDATVKVAWKVPLSLSGLAPLGFLDDLPVELVSVDLPVAGIALQRGNGDHELTGEVVVPRTRVDQQELVTFEVSAYGLSTERATLVLKADLPKAKPRHETARFRTALEELEQTAAAAKSASQRASAECGRAESLADRLRIEVARVEALIDDAQSEADVGLETEAPSGSLIADAAAALDRARAAAEEIGLLGNASVRAKEEACSGGSAAATIESQTRNQLVQVRNAVADLRRLAQPTDQVPATADRRARIDSTNVAIPALFDLANEAFAAIDSARQENQTLLGLRGRSLELFDQVQRALELEARSNPDAELGELTDRAAAARSKVRSAMETSAGCEGDLWTPVAELLARSQQAEQQLRQLSALVPPVSVVGSSVVPKEVLSDLRSAEAYQGAAELVAESVMNRMADARACIASTAPASASSSAEASSWDTGTQEPDRSEAEWPSGSMEQGCRTPDATVRTMQALLDRLQSVLGQRDRFAEETAATQALAGFGADPLLCPIHRARLADALRDVDGARRQASENAREAMQAANAGTRASRVRREQVFANAAQSLVALRAALDEPQQPVAPVPGRGGSADPEATTDPAVSQTSPGEAASTSQCQALQQRIVQAISRWQQHSVRPPQDRDAAWCQKTLAMSRGFGDLMAEAESQGCTQFQSASDRNGFLRWQQGMDSAACS